jgi:AraC family transcriptional regulator
MEDMKMRFMIFVKATKDSEAGVMPSEQLLTEMGQFNEELVKAGVMLAGEGLHPSSKGARERFHGDKRIVIDGPFAETKELIAGFWIWQVKSKEEAIEWVKRCPNPHNEDGEIEIRQVFEAEDFGAEFTPELKRQEAGIRAQTLGLGAVKFEQGREMIVAGINKSYTFETRVKIPMQWEGFVPYIRKVPEQTGNVAYGICWNYRPAHGFDYLSGVEVKDTAKLPAEFATVRLPAQEYAVFTHAHHVSTIGATIDKIWNSWVPQSGLKIKESPSFERYTEEFNPQTGMGGMEIWIPIAQ